MRKLLVTLAVSLLLAHQGQPADVDTSSAVEYDGISREKIVVPMVFPVAGKCSWSDTFLAPRDGGARRHHGNDIMARKMTPLVAVFDGCAYPRRSTFHNMLSLIGDNGWTATYMHINNDTPGTDDGLCSDQYAFVPGLADGSRVKAGQVLAYVGDSGNAENTSPHLHFELCRGEPFAIINPAPSLRHARKISKPSKWLPGSVTPEDFVARVPCGIYNFAVVASDIFVEGDVISVNDEAGRFVVSATSITLVKGGKIALSPARKKAVTVSTGTHYHWSATLDALPAFADIKAGRHVCVLGRNLGVGSVLPAKNIILEGSPKSTGKPDKSEDQGS